jgi:hypothetical protein
MINVVLELWPFGLPKNKKRLGRIKIANVGGTPDRGNYLIRIYNKEGTEVRTTRVFNFPRRTKSAIELLALALKASGYGREARK